MPTSKKFKKTPLLNTREFFQMLKKRQKIKPAILVAYVFLALSALAILFLWIIYLVFLKGLPSIYEIESLTLPESSVIRDRNGNELYSVFSGEDGKRTYVEINGMSQTIIDAVIATEDKTFFDNAGIDVKGLIRSLLNYVTGKTDKIQGTSTISQQLIKITFLDNERSLERKIKEAYLSYRLNTTYSKEKILELYLNKISFGHNASWVEEASKTFFGKSAKDVQILGATILASLPKGPTYFSPYNYRDRLMGYLYVYKDGKTEEKITLSSPEKMKDFRPLVEAFKETINTITFERINGEDAKVCGLDQSKLKARYSIDSAGCERMAYKEILTLINSIRIDAANIEWLTTGASGSWKTQSGATAKPTATGSVDGKQSLTGYALEYNTGRKDFVASRMLEDDKIQPEDFKKVIVDGLEFQFRKNVQAIKYPHFVMYVQEYLTKLYGDDFFDQGWLQIYTTIDPKLQDKAEALVKKQALVNRDKYGATGLALISLDNKTGQILSMVGWPDYYNDAEQWKVNVITSLKQPGSSFKPIVYALAMSKDAVGPETPIYDVDTKFWSWDPDNYDRKFLGKMKIRTALDYSRNIPAIKMFKVAGGEEEVVKHSKSIGISSLRDDGKYGMPLAIGTGELKPIELAQAYSVFANEGWRREPEPILKIVDKKWNILNEYVETKGKYVFSDAASYLLSAILSDAKSRPGAFWNNVLTLKDRPVAAKTGTSNKDVSEWGVKKILPRDLWTAGYTPQITTVVWAGNVDGSETKGTCDGLNCAAPVWRDYMEFAHVGLPVMQFKKPEGVVSANISTITGRLASSNTPDSERITWLFAVKPTKYESASKQVTVDTLCNGRVTDQTPPEAIRTGYLVDLDPIVESYDSTWISATKRWASASQSWSGGLSQSGYITSYSDEPCSRPTSAIIRMSTNLVDGINLALGRGTITIQYNSEFPIARFKVFKGGDLVKDLFVEEPKIQGQEKLDMNYSVDYSGEQILTVMAIDSFGFSEKYTYTVNFWGNLEWPWISMKNPVEGDSTIALYEWQSMNLRFSVSDPVEVTAINIYLDGELYKIIGAENLDVTTPIGEDIPVGTYSLEIQATSATRAKSRVLLQLDILKR